MYVADAFRDYDMWLGKLLQKPEKHLTYLLILLHAQMDCLIVHCSEETQILKRKLNNKIRSICSNAQSLSLYPVRLIFEIEIVYPFDWKILLLLKKVLSFY